MTSVAVAPEQRRPETREEVELGKLIAERDLARLTAFRTRRWMLNESSSDFDDRRLVFTGQVNETSVKYATEEIGRLRRLSTEHPITVVLNTPGGSCMHGLALFDVLTDAQEAGITIHTVAYGMAASMGAVLLQAGTTRAMSRNAYMMIHEVSSMTGGKQADMADDVKFTARLWERLAELIAERSSWTGEALRHEVHRRDWWLDADEALEHGFIDQVHG